MSEIITVLLIFLAVFRITRFITKDAVPFEEAREAFVHRWGVFDDAKDKTMSISGLPTMWFMRKLAYLVECAWCASVWTSIVVVCITMQIASVPLPLLTIAAASAMTGIVTELMD